MRECNGHPAGPYDNAGETVYCDGSCRQFAHPHGTSALRRATKGNPRNLPCPTCKQPNRLTPKDKRLGYQCDECARIDEGGF